MTARRTADVPWFAFEGELRRVPSGPSHCPCGAALEPMRRYAGLCGACVRSRRTSPPPRPTDHLRSRMVLVSEEWRQRPGETTKRDHYARIRCTCGSERLIFWHVWTRRPPACCNACRLRAIDAGGFEPEKTRTAARGVE